MTGSTGLLGSNLVRALESQGHEVVGLVRSEAKGRRLLGDTGVQFVSGDMRDVAGFAGALAGCDVLFHTAAYFRESFQPGDHWGELEAINITAMVELMRAADRQGVGCAVHVSSSGTVGMKADGSPGDEETPPDPVMVRTLYYKAKVAGDAALAAFVPEHGLRIVRVHPGWMWGPGDAGPTTAGQFALDFLARQIPGIIDGGASLVDARDVAAAMVTAAERGAHGSAYLLGGGYYALEEILQSLERVTGVAAPTRRLPHTLLMVVAWGMELVGRLTGGQVLITRDGVRSLHAKLQVCSDKAIRELGATFRPLDDTVRDTVNWYSDHPDWREATS